MQFLLVSLTGLCLSLYALFVELHDVLYPDQESIDSFVPLCDIAAIKASCSSVFSMEEGHMLRYFGIVPKGHIFDVPNAALGVVFYTSMMLHYLLLSNGKQGEGGKRFSKPIAKVMSLGASVASLWLITILISIKEFCIVCVGTHCCNAFILYRLWTDRVEGKRYLKVKRKAN